MRSTSVKSFAATLILLFALAASVPAAPRQEPRDRDESAIVRLQKIAKRFILRLMPQETPTLPLP
ncbi:MAG TPA: hypothetical protein VFO89_10200 [Thermoanaerobaculia bacterium]|nr:hypothetical protein [Thermoanaerobaculia bacterium]